MSTGNNPFRPSRFYAQAVVLLLILNLLLLPGCHRHSRPSPVAGSQTGIVKRQLNTDGTYYVRSGDTLYAIAFGYGLDAMDVARLNGITSPYTIYPGQKIQLMPPSGGSPNTESGAGVKINALKTPAPATTRTVETQKPSGVEMTEPPKAAPVTSPAPSVADNAPVTSPAPSVGDDHAGPTSWSWPTEGFVIRGFVAGDPARNGLDIAGKEGQPITASSAGQVVYSGNGLIGYGELIIVKHSENELSAYAHNRVRLVKEGDQVWAGQKIAEMGRNSRDEQVLHFEIRQLGKPVNPLTYLPSR